MEARLLLLLTLLPLGRTDLLSNSSEERRVSPRPRFADDSVVRFKDLDGLLHHTGDDDDHDAGEGDKKRAALSWAFSLGNRKPSGVNFEDNTVGRIDAIQATKSSAKSTASTFISRQLTLNQEQGGNLDNAGAEDDLDSLSPEEELDVRPGLRLEADGGGVLAVRMVPLGYKWVNWLEEHRPRARRRRSWLWNQFFVIEEYRGPEPVLIGRVSSCLCCILSGTKHLPLLILDEMAV